MYMTGLTASVELSKEKEPKGEEKNLHIIFRRSVAHTAVQDWGVNSFNLPVVDPLTA